MGVAVLVAAWLALFADKTPDDQVASAALPVKAKTAQTTPARPATGKSKAERNVAILALIPRASLITVGHADLAGTPRNEPNALFSAHSWTAQTQADAKPPEPPAPVAPPLRFKFIGKKFEDGAWEVYLAQNDTTFVARVDSVIDNKYHVDAIGPNAVMLTYLPLNQAQRLNIRGND
jgi:hypothetical protein